ncbi:MAG: hypothetical protein AAB947_01280 [Patescibacteria group bacterium]
MHPDNGTSLLNYHVYEYAATTGIAFSRSRPYKKNDNCFVEQKNSTHVRQIIGYLRFDTEEERLIISNLYRNELRLYKNYFQPVMKVTEKIRDGGKLKKKFDVAKTPFQRLLESPDMGDANKQKLRAEYATLNPAELKRSIDAKLKKLHTAYAKHARQSAPKTEVSGPFSMSLLYRLTRHTLYVHLVFILSIQIFLFIIIRLFDPFHEHLRIVNLASYGPF